MTERDASPAGEEGYEAPRKEMGSYEEGARYDKEKEEKDRREGFV